MNKTNYNSRGLIWGALAILVAGMAWTVSCFTVGAKKADCRRSCDTVSCAD